MTLASGTKDRDRGAVVPLGRDRLPTGHSVEIDLSPLYDALRSRIEDFNVEGCAVRGELLHLFQRGNDEGGINARIDLSLAEFIGDAATGRPPSPDHIIDVAEYELGQLRGVKLCFSDAVGLDDGRVVFTCSAEATGPDGDGRVAGSGIGIMDQDGQVTLLEPVDLDVKIEGMTAMTAQDDGIRVLLVTDADDPATPSPLLEARLESE